MYWYGFVFTSALAAAGDAIRITGLICLVEPRGFEPLTSAVRLRRSPN
jgi:hypothetical protein